MDYEKYIMASYNVAEKIKRLEEENKKLYEQLLYYWDIYECSEPK